MVILLILLIIAIVILAIDNKQVVPEEDLGQTVLAEKIEEASEAQATEVETETIAEPTSVDLPNEKEVRLYVGGAGVMELVTEYNSAWTPDADIAIFEAINSDEDTIYYDDYYALHESYWNAVTTDTDYKIGYELSFDIDGENRVYTILKPDDIVNSPDLFMGDVDNEEVTGYMGVWVYNDIGQTAIYYHLTQDQMTEGVLMTSIKLRPTPQMASVSNCKLKVFSYSSEEEFNSAGRYIGTHGYEIAVNNQ